MLGGLCVLVLAIMLVAGLWPFHAPPNEVNWLSGRNGIRLGVPGTLLSRGELRLNPRTPDAPFSIEIWAKPARRQSAGRLLVFYNPRAPLELSIFQSTDTLGIDIRKSSTEFGQQFYAGDVFLHSLPVFLTLTSDMEGTHVYANASLVRTFTGFHPNLTIQPSEIVIGTSATAYSGWSGELYGLAVYDTALNPQRVQDHFISWTEKAKPNLDPADGAAALYLFNEHSGRVAHNAIQPSADLIIPERFTIFRHELLTPFWLEYNSTLSYWKDILINITGFIPLGFCFCAYWAQRQSAERAALCAILLGFAVSFSIEILQSYLPTRQSGTTDLFTNTLGSWIGAALYLRPGIRIIFHDVLSRLSFVRNL